MNGRPPLDAETLRDLGQTIHRFWQLGARIRVEASRHGRPVVIADQELRVVIQPRSTQGRDEA